MFIMTRKTEWSWQVEQNFATREELIYKIDKVCVKNSVPALSLVLYLSCNKFVYVLVNAYASGVCLAL